MKKVLFLLVLSFTIWACQKDVAVADELLAPIHPPLPCDNCEAQLCYNAIHYYPLTPQEYFDRGGNGVRHCTGRCAPASCQ